ncbi:hypothetical protein J437_LFUL007516 [Ladona fulva]|uniref:UPF0547 domain-containing protein n=1 Tax=Ladona fulva TaxID=123851 RepID=A0A8K0K439_LADFU|nr:hypothetical protein J437_LFUL007516 [Ladona fulva]
MPKNKMITKSCPKCEQQLPVACKACRCGHNFFNARRGSSSAIRAAVPLEDGAGGSAEGTGDDDGVVKRRRTERVRRVKPNYYDALEYDNQMKKAKQVRTNPPRHHKNSSSTFKGEDDDEEGGGGEEDDEEVGEEEEDEDSGPITRGGRGDGRARLTRGGGQAGKRRRRRKGGGGRGGGRGGGTGVGIGVEEEEEEDLMAGITPEKGLLYSAVLAEINRKIIAAGWRA